MRLFFLALPLLAISATTSAFPTVNVLKPHTHEVPREIQVNLALADLHHEVISSGPVQVEIRAMNSPHAARVQMISEWNASEKIWQIRDRYPVSLASAERCPIPSDARGDFWSHPVRWQVFVRAPRKVQVRLRTLSP